MLAPSPDNEVSLCISHSSMQAINTFSSDSKNILNFNKKSSMYNRRKKGLDKGCFSGHEDI